MVSLVVLIARRMRKANPGNFFLRSVKKFVDFKTNNLFNKYMVNLNSDLIRRAEDKVLEVYLLAQDVFRQNFVLPTVKFDLNSTRIAGFAQYSTNTIQINSHFFVKFPLETVRDTIPHEIGHLLNDKLFPNRKQRHHGPEFRYVGQKLNIPFTRCHSMSLDENIDKYKRRFEYRCPCGKTFHLTSNLHTKIQRGNHRICNRCKQRIVFVGIRKDLDNEFPG